MELYNKLPRSKLRGITKELHRKAMLIRAARRFASPPAAARMKVIAKPGFEELNLILIKIVCGTPASGGPHDIEEADQGV